MKNGEVALVTIPPEYAFGSTESKQDLAVVPPNSTVIYEVELVSFVKVCFSLCYIFVCISFSCYDECTGKPIIIHGTQDKESWDLNNTEKIETAGAKKEEGNALFKLGKYVRASKRYEKVWHASFVEHLFK